MKKSTPITYKIDEDGYILKYYDDPLFTIKELKELTKSIKKTLKEYKISELNDNEINELNENSRKERGIGL